MKILTIHTSILYYEIILCFTVLIIKGTYLFNTRQSDAEDEAPCFIQGLSGMQKEEHFDSEDTCSFSANMFDFS